MAETHPQCCRKRADRLCHVVSGHVPLEIIKAGTDGVRDERRDHSGAHAHILWPREQQHKAPLQKDKGETETHLQCCRKRANRLCHKVCRHVAHKVIRAGTDSVCHKSRADSRVHTHIIWPREQRHKAPLQKDKGETETHPQCCRKRANRLCHKVCGHVAHKVIKAGTDSVCHKSRADSRVHTHILWPREQRHEAPQWLLLGHHAQTVLRETEPLYHCGDGLDDGAVRENTCMTMRKAKQASIIICKGLGTGTRHHDAMPQSHHTPRGADGLLR
jgi:hypothetical protein